MQEKAPAATDPNANHDFLVVIPEGMWESYYAALGKFLHMFGRAESSLCSTVNLFVKERVTPRHPDGYFVIEAVMAQLTLARKRSTNPTLFKPRHR